MRTRQANVLPRTTARFVADGAALGLGDARQGRVGALGEVPEDRQRLGVVGVGRNLRLKILHSDLARSVLPLWQSRGPHTPASARAHGEPQVCGGV